MHMKTILAAILGGLIMFGWGAFSHLVLPLGMVGMRSVPIEREQALVGPMKASLTERSIYFFPAMEEEEGDMTQDQKEARRQAFEAKHLAGPTGIIAYNPAGSEVMSMRQLGIELGLNIVACALIALCAARFAGYGARVLVAVAFGAFAVVAIDGSYWNWFGFPTLYFGAQAANGIVEAGLSGLVIAALARPSAGFGGMP
jgi:hypothetical protein